MSGNLSNSFKSIEFHQDTNSPLKYTNVTSNTSSNILKIGAITFYLQQSKNKLYPILLLRNYYSGSKTENGTQEIKIVNFNRLQTQDPSQTNNYQQSDKLRLENVSLQHFHSVASTDQTKYSLKKSEYKKKNHTSESLFKFDSLFKVQFLNLEKMDLSSSDLCSIESLSFADMPQLKRLELQKNLITKLNTLSQLSCKNLNYLSYYDNRIVQNSLFYRGFFPNLNRIIVDSEKMQANLTRETYQNFPQHNTMPYIDHIFKAESLFQIKEFLINKRKRIFPLKFKFTLKSINPEIKLKSKMTNQELMNRLQRLGGIGRDNDPVRFRRFLLHEVEPVLRHREQNNPNNVNAINLIRQGLTQRLQQLIANAALARRPFQQPSLIPNFRRDQPQIGTNDQTVQNQMKNEAQISPPQVQEMNEPYEGPLENQQKMEEDQSENIRMEVQNLQIIRKGSEMSEEKQPSNSHIIHQNTVPSDGSLLSQNDIDQKITFLNSLTQSQRRATKVSKAELQQRMNMMKRNKQKPNTSIIDGSQNTSLFHDGDRMNLSEFSTLQRVMRNHKND